MFISPTAAADYNERFRDMYTFSELISNIRKVGKIDSRKMQGQSAFIENSVMAYKPLVLVDQTHPLQVSNDTLDIQMGTKGQNTLVFQS